MSVGKYLLLFHLLLTDELTKLVMPEVETLGMSSSETFNVGHTPQLHPHQLMSDPQGGWEVHIQLHSLTDTGGHVVLGNTEIYTRLEPGNDT